MNDYQVLETYHYKQKDLIESAEKARQAKLAQLAEKPEKKNVLVQLLRRG